MNKPQPAATYSMSPAVDATEWVEVTDANEPVVNYPGQVNYAAPESNAQKFARLATKRTNKALKAIALLKNLSNRNQYEYTPAQIKVVIDSLQAELNLVEESFLPKVKVITSIDLMELNDVAL